MEHELWAGMDIGRSAHHCVVIDVTGKALISQRVDNTEAALIPLVTVLAQLPSARVTWAVDQSRGNASLLIALLHQNGQTVLYLPGKAFHHAAQSYRGEGKTDAIDAKIIADQARVRSDLRRLRTGEDALFEFRILVSQRDDLVEDRVRLLNRLQNQLVEYFPALERALDFRTRGALILLTGGHTPEAIRQKIEDAELLSWLKDRKVRTPNRIALAAAHAANSQHSKLPGQDFFAAGVSRMAHKALDIGEEITALDEEIAARADRSRSRKHC